MGACAVLSAEGIEVAEIPPLTPKANAFAAEHWGRPSGAEVTDRLLIAGPGHLRVVLDEYVAHYNKHRRSGPGT